MSLTSSRKPFPAGCEIRLKLEYAGTLASILREVRKTSGGPFPAYVNTSRVIFGEWEL